jgi:hypothetical protein
MSLNKLGGQNGKENQRLFRGSTSDRSASLNERVTAFTYFFLVLMNQGV